MVEEHIQRRINREVDSSRSGRRVRLVVQSDPNHLSSSGGMTGYLSTGVVFENDLFEYVSDRSKKDGLIIIEDVRITKAKCFGLRYILEQSLCSILQLF